MGDVDNVFIGADTVVGRHLVVGELVQIEIDAVARVGRAANGALLLGPLEGVKSKGGPMLVGVATRIDLIAEPQQHEMPRSMRTEAGHLHVVAHGVGVGRALVGRPREELLLVVEARSPGQHAAYFEILALNVVEHVLREDALGRDCVVSAAGGVNVVIARPVAEQARIDPTLQLDV